MQKNKESSFIVLKLTGLFSLFVAFFFFICPSVTSGASYMVYLRNGRVITGIHEVKKEPTRVTIHKNSIIFTLPADSVIKIEEYTNNKIPEEKDLEQTTTAKGQIPDYLRYRESPQYSRYTWQRGEYEDLKKQRLEIIDKLEKFEDLGGKIKELENPAFRGSKARRANRYKAILLERQKNLERKDSLLIQKRQLEFQIELMENE